MTRFASGWQRTPARRRGATTWGASSRGSRPNIKPFSRRKEAPMNDVLSPAASRRQQVEIEAQLAQRLTDASASERRRLYGAVYDQIYDMHLSRDPLQLDFGARIELVKFLRKLTRA